MEVRVLVGAVSEGPHVGAFLVRVMGRDSRRQGRGDGQPARPGRARAQPGVAATDQLALGDRDDAVADVDAAVRVVRRGDHDLAAAVTDGQRGGVRSRLERLFNPLVSPPKWIFGDGPEDCVR